MYRTKKIGFGGKAIDFSEPKVTELQQLQASATADQITNNPLGPPTPTVAEIEQSITKWLGALNEGEDAKRRRLIRATAMMNLQHDFEVVYRLIFGSQLEVLLRANAGSLDEAGADALYQNAKAQFPIVHLGGSLDGRLGFLVNHGLINRNNGRISTTPKGKEFMQYLVEFGLTAPNKGG